MMNLTRNLLVTAAALAGSAAAFGQSRADVPFAFEVRGAKLPAGTYAVNETFGESTKTITLVNRETRKTVLISALQNEHSKVNQPVESQLVFTCAEERCALQEIWSESSAMGYRIPGVKLGKADQSKIVAVRLSADRKAD